MHRSYESHDSNYHGGDSRSSIDEYIERVTRMQRMPSVTTDDPDVANVHKVLNNNSAHAHKHEGHQKKIFHVNHQHRAPEMRKKVYFAEHEKTNEIGRDGKTIDVEADGYIQQKHKNFESCNSGTFKAY